MAADKVMMDYLAAVAASNTGDFEPFVALQTPDCTMHNVFGLVATGPDATREALRGAGFGNGVTMTILSASVAGRTFAVTFRNDFADGRPPMFGIGMAGFDEDGRITTMRALGEQSRTLLTNA